jgi:anaerobic C4-dicarboxylate transporter DcuA/anaerobic C4-dicarboxylate transporter DcuB
MSGFVFALQALVVIGCVIMGVRMGGMGLGIWGAAGVAVLVFGFGLSPGATPGSAMLIILAVITAASAMQAAGGIDYLVTIAAKIIRKNPRWVTLIAPLVSYAFVVGAGTSNIFFPLIPVIYEVSYSSGIRPERPLGLSVIATGLGITSSPVSAAMAAMLALTAAEGLGLNQILMITIPSSIVAIVAASFVSMRLGKELADDPVYQQRLADGLVEPPHVDAGSEQQVELPAGAARSAYIFLSGVGFVILLGAVPQLKAMLPEGADMTIAIELTMFVVALLIMLLCNAKAADVIKQPVFSAGVTAIVALFGIAWLANTFINAHLEQIVAVLGNAVAAVPLVFAAAVFIVAALTTSQSATTNTVVPIGLALGTLGVGPIVAMWQALVGVYLLPANGNQLACVETDLTGSTRIGKYVLNHSFQVPLWVCTVVSIAVGLVLTSIYGF